MERKTLAEIIEREMACRVEGGCYGITACKESILWYEAHGRSFFQQLEEYVERANEDVLFNKRMVLACWELINE